MNTGEFSTGWVLDHFTKLLTEPEHHQPESSDDNEQDGNEN